MELIPLLNCFTVCYIVVTMYRLFFKVKNMSDGVQHHIVSHLFIVFSADIALNLFVYKGWIAPMVFSFLYLLQHTIKEDNRMVNIGKWTAKVDGSRF